MPAGPAGGSMEMGNKGRRDNFVKVNGFIKKRKKLILIVIKFILAKISRKLMLISEQIIQEMFLFIVIRVL